MSGGRISERAAAGVLGELGLGREQARQVLRTGAAGSGTLEAGVRWYDAARVAELRRRPFADEQRLGVECPRGIYVARLARGRTLDLTRPWKEQAVALAHQPVLTPMTRALLSALIEVSGGLPWVATVSGFTVFAGLATGVSDDPRGTSFALTRPGPWAHEIEGRWFPTGPGRTWVHWRPPPRATDQPLQQWTACPAPTVSSSSVVDREATRRPWSRPSSALT